MTGMLDYACAKAGGILSRSYLGPALQSLAAREKLSDIALTLFPDESFKLPEKLLVRRLQARFDAKVLADCVALVASLSGPPALLVEQLRVREREYLRASLLARDSGKEPDEPPDLGPFATIRSSAYPSLEAMFHGSPLAPFLASYSSDRFVDFDASLSADYYSGLLKAASLLGRESPAGALAVEEARRRNCSWALRMRVYYKFPVETASPYLVGEDQDRLAALKVFTYPLDSREAWSGWAYASSLGSTEGGAWSPDPTAFERLSALELYRKAALCFRTNPLSVDRIYAFLKLKEREADSVRSILEGIPLGVSKADMLHFLGADQ